jgi:hypothetical protein
MYRTNTTIVNWESDSSRSMKKGQIQSLLVPDFFANGALLCKVTLFHKNERKCPMHLKGVSDFYAVSTIFRSLANDRYIVC